MKQPLIIVLLILLWIGAAVGVHMADDSQAGVTFTSTRVTAIDVQTLHITIQAPRGEVWLLPVAHRELLDGVVVGDRVSLETDEDGRVTKLVKLSSPSPAS